MSFRRYIDRLVEAGRERDAAEAAAEAAAAAEQASKPYEFSAEVTDAIATVNRIAAEIASSNAREFGASAIRMASAPRAQQKVLRRPDGREIMYAAHLIPIE